MSGNRITVRFDEQDLYGKVHKLLQEGYRLSLTHAGSPGTGPITLESIAYIGSALAIRESPEAADPTGWQISRNKTLYGLLEDWAGYVKDTSGNFKRGPRGGLGFYLRGKKTQKQPLLGHRR